MTPDAPIAGAVPGADRLADIAAIEALAVAYAYAIDDGDWSRWRALFEPDGFVDYRSAGGACGTPAEVARWMAEALTVFTFCQHSVSTHEICFVGDDRATGRVHVSNRNGVEWEGTVELLEVGAVYHDRYVRHRGRWTIARRVEETLYATGGGFAALVRSSIRPVELDRPSGSGE